jgi:nicotinamide-nucleotide amidase
MSAGDALAVRVGRALLARAARLALAESCTGGLVGSRVTGVPGSSRYLLGGIIAYHNSTKTALLRVSRRMLARHGAVSAPVAAAMARGARRAFKAEIAVAVSGVAGPGGGSAEKPVGLVYFAVSGPEGEVSIRRLLPGRSRELITGRSVSTALYLLYRRLEGTPIEE